jgi:hypothetical protein
LADAYGPEHATAAGQVVGSFFGKIFKAVTAPVQALASPVLDIAKQIPGVSTVLNTASSLLPAAGAIANFIPGVGPIASMAMKAATPMLQNMLQSGGHLPPEARRYAGTAAPRSMFPSGAPYGGGGFGGGGGGGGPGGPLHIHVHPFG